MDRSPQFFPDWLLRLAIAPDARKFDHRVGQIPLCCSEVSGLSLASPQFKAALTVSFEGLRGAIACLSQDSLTPEDTTTKIY